MSITDAFFAFNYETQNGAETASSSFPDWLSRLAYQLIHNDFDQQSMASPISNRRSSIHVAPVIVKSHEQHSLLNLSLLSPFNSTHCLTNASATECCSKMLEMLHATLFHSFELTLPADQKNPRRQCSVRNCKRKTELYCSTCSKIDHGNGHRLFFCCGAGQRVTVKRNEQGSRSAPTTTITTPLCYKWHLDHCNDVPSSESEDA
jgi:hypothetical protein